MLSSAAGTTDENARSIINRARDGLSGNPAAAIVFAGHRVDSDDLYRLLRARLGSAVHVVGGSAVGVIAPHMVAYTGNEIGIALLEGMPEDFVYIYADNRVAQGARAGEEIAAAASREPSCSQGLLFYDSVASYPPPALHSGSRLLRSMYRSLRSPLQLFGAGCLSTLGLDQSFVFGPEGPSKHLATALLCPAHVRLRSHVMHGCYPATPYMELTRVEGNVVYEIDGKPAFDVVRDATGIDFDPEELMLSVTIGSNCGEKFGAFREDEYVNRLVLRADAKIGALILFEADFETGQSVQLMLRNNEHMLRSVESVIGSLPDHYESVPPFLYFDCAGRTRALTLSEREEAQLVVDRTRALGVSPFLGCYTGVEVAPVHGISRPFDWTGVLVSVAHR